MDYKEKLEEAKRLYETANADQKYVLESLFPELKESEDERIIKMLVDIVNITPATVAVKNRQTLLDWLEKQGECHISHDDEIMIKQLTEYFTTGHGLQNTIESVVEWLNDVKEKLEKRGEVESDNDDIEVEEKGIREAFNKIEDEKQCKQKPQRMISAEAKEAMYNKPADTVEPKCEESKTKIFDAPTPFEDKLYAFVLACEILVDPSKREFILEHSQEILDAAREQIGKEQESAWSEEDEVKINRIVACLENLNVADNDILLKDVDWLKSLKQRIGGLTDFDVIGEVVQRNLLEEVVKQMSDTLLVETLLYRKKQGTLSIFYDERKEELERFLKSICTWKPSDEQMAILYKYAEQNNYDGSILTSLYNELKKLREE